MKAGLTAMECTEGKPHPASYRLFWNNDVLVVEAVGAENCTYGEPDASVIVGQFAFRKIRFIFLCEAMARKFELI